MVDLNNMLANYAVSWANLAASAEQTAEQHRQIQEWKRARGDKWSVGDQIQALKLDNEAEVWRQRVEYAKRGLVLCDYSDPNWTMSEYADLVREAAKQHRLVHVQYAPDGRISKLQPTPYVPGLRQAGTGA
jgi:hypothetical protein